MARAKRKSKPGGSPLERWVGTALTGVVLAKVALDHHDDEPTAVHPDGNGQQPPATEARLRLADDDRGRKADSPTEIPKKGWLDIVWRARLQVKEDAVPLLSGGVAYYALLALFPGLIALVSI